MMAECSLSVHMLPGSPEWVLTVSEENGLFFEDKMYSQIKEEKYQPIETAMRISYISWKNKTEPSYVDITQ